MSINGKKAYKVYLDKKNIDLIRFHLRAKRNQGGLSHVLDRLIRKTALAIEHRYRGIEPDKLSSSAVYGLLINYIKEEQEAKTL